MREREGPVDCRPEDSVGQVSSRASCPRGGRWKKEDGGMEDRMRWGLRLNLVHVAEFGVVKALVGFEVEGAHVEPAQAYGLREAREAVLER